MEEATNELINMLMEFDHGQKEELKGEVKGVEENSGESKTKHHFEPELLLFLFFSKLIEKT